MSAHPPMNAAVWFEIPVTDIDKAKAFYGAVVQGELIEQNDGPNPNPMATFPVNDMKTGVSGSIYPGNPPTSGSGNTVHLAAPGRLEDAPRRPPVSNCPVHARRPVGHGAETRGAA